jgi:hypothetical protein
MLHVGWKAKAGISVHRVGFARSLCACYFVADFCLSEEDKTTDTSIEFWFRCCNLDNDGVITTFQMEHFYREQLYRMHCLNVEAVPIADLLCQLYVCKRMLASDSS